MQVSILELLLQQATGESNLEDPGGIAPQPGAPPGLFAALLSGQQAQNPAEAAAAAHQETALVPEDGHQPRRAAVATESGPHATPDQAASAQPDVGVAPVAVEDPAAEGAPPVSPEPENDSAENALVALSAQSETSSVETVLPAITPPAPPAEAGSAGPANRIATVPSNSGESPFLRGETIGNPRAVEEQRAWPTPRASETATETVNTVVRPETARANNPIVRMVAQPLPDEGLGSTVVQAPAGEPSGAAVEPRTTPSGATAGATEQPKGSTPAATVPNAPLTATAARPVMVNAQPASPPESAPASPVAATATRPVMVNAQSASPPEAAPATPVAATAPRPVAMATLPDTANPTTVAALATRPASADHQTAQSPAAQGGTSQLATVPAEGADPQRTWVAVEPKIQTPVPPAANRPVLQQPNASAPSQASPPSVNGTASPNLESAPPVRVTATPSPRAAAATTNPASRPPILEAVAPNDQAEASVNRAAAKPQSIRPSARPEIQAVPRTQSAERFQDNTPADRNIPFARQGLGPHAFGRAAEGTLAKAQGLFETLDSGRPARTTGLRLRPPAQTVTQAIVNAIGQDRSVSETTAIRIVTPAEVSPVERPTIRTLLDFTVKSVRYLAGRGEETLTVRLIPESLGELRIVVRSTGAAMEIHLSSANPAVRGALESHLAGLHDALARVGVEVGKVVISGDTASPGGPSAFTGGNTTNQGQETRPQASFQTAHPRSERNPKPAPRMEAAHEDSLNVLV